ncbi:MAG TPA: SRPBCC family protein [Vicinamibacterales bacterium]|nr:SRPBCC family protein [Vicinamibacterales bacterium]
MASIHKEVLIDAPADRIWDALRDVGAIHTRLARGFVTDTRLEGDTRDVTFSNGAVVRERIVDLDDRVRRIAYAAVGGRFTHHSASIQVFPDGDSRSRVVWIADLLPNDVAALIGGMMEQGCAAMKRTLEQSNPIVDRHPAQAEA